MDGKVVNLIGYGPVCFKISSSASLYVILVSETGLGTLGICRLPNLIGPGGGLLTGLMARGPVGTTTPGGNPGGGRGPCWTRALDLSGFIVARFHPDWVFARSCTQRSIRVVQVYAGVVPDRERLLARKLKVQESAET
jgi:hypothetical protein